MIITCCFILIFMLTSLLCSAVEKNDTDAIKSLIERGANLDFPSSKMNRSALHLACLNGNVEIVELLCENNVDIEALDSQGSSPLILAWYVILYNLVCLALVQTLHHFHV